METLHLHLFIIISFTIITKFILTKTTPKKKLPPSPWKLPIIGHLHHLIGSMDRPQQRVTQLAKKHGDLMHLQLGKMSLLVVSSREVATEVLKTHDHAFADRPEFYSVNMQPNFGRLVAASKYNDYWKQMKRVFTSELLSTKRVQSFSSIREEEGSNLIESIRLAGGLAINLTEELFLFASSVICRAAFGSKNKDQLRLVKLANELVMEAAEFNVIEMLPVLEVVYVMNGMKAKLMKMHEEADEILESILNKRYGEVVKGDKESILDILIRIQRSGNLEVATTREDIKANIAELFIGGTYPPSIIMTWAMAELLKNPRIMVKAQAQIRRSLKGSKVITESDIQKLSYIKQIIKETLRLHIPGPFLFPRECRTECEINGYRIPEKTKLIINAWGLSRDPRYWKNPDSFIPERFEGISVDYTGSNLEYIPFGAGRRMCPGFTFGLLNMELLLAKLLYHFDWKLAQPEKLDMSEVYGAIIRKKKDLVVIATPYT